MTTGDRRDEPSEPIAAAEGLARPPTERDGCLEISDPDAIAIRIRTP